MLPEMSQKVDSRRCCGTRSDASQRHVVCTQAGACFSSAGVKLPRMQPGLALGRCSLCDGAVAAVWGQRGPNYAVAEQTFKDNGHEVGRRAPFYVLSTRRRVQTFGRVGRGNRSWAASAANRYGWGFVIFFLPLLGKVCLRVFGDTVSVHD